MEKKILIIDKDDNLTFLLSEFLKLKDFVVEIEPDYVKSLDKINTKLFEMCIIDVSAYDESCQIIIENIATRNPRMPIIATSANESPTEAVELLRGGCKDYLKKPFRIEELYLRIQNLINLNPSTDLAHTITAGRYTFRRDIQQLEVGDTVIKLTTKESELLGLLLENLNALLDRNVALMKIWNKSTDDNTRSIDVYITRLRRKLEAYTDIQIINVHGKGFRMTLDEGTE